MSVVATPAADVLSGVLAQRFSCRGFRPDPVPRPTIEQILTMAQHSPSWCNTQPWRVIVTEGAGTEAVRRGLSRYAAAHPPTPDLPFPERYEGVALERRRECAWQLYACVGVARGDREASARQAAENFELFGAPHLAVVTTERALGVYGAVDCGVYVATFLMAAQSLGVATVPQAAIAACAPFVREHFALDPDRQVLCGISFGYADDAHPANGFRTTRAALADTVTWAGWSHLHGRERVEINDRPRQAVAVQQRPRHPVGGEAARP
jgi:nitroreductase